MRAFLPHSTPDVLPLIPSLPKPALTWFNATPANGETVTAITRKWPPGTGYCGRCPRFLCNSRDDVCMIVVVGAVARSDAPILTLDEAACLGVARDDLGARPDGGPPLFPVVGDGQAEDA